MPDNTNKSGRIVAILAGGQSRRMGYADKAIFEINGRRLIDLVIECVRPQANQIVLSATNHFGTKLEFIPDNPNKLAGPAAGLWAVASWVMTHSPQSKRFFTVPVDAPLVPHNLFYCLGNVSGSAIAKTASGLHPTFACWEVKPLLDALEKVPTGETISLKALAERVNAYHVIFESERNFANINSPKDARVFEGR